MTSPAPDLRPSRATLTLLHVGGPTTVLRVGGLTIVTDPTFDDPGSYPLPGGRQLTKLTPPAVPVTSLGRVDVALVSHDQHPDNLDTSGRALLADVPTALSTTEAAGRLPGVTGLEPWQEHRVTRPDGGELVVTAVPARHGPEGCEPYTGTVVGFVLRGDGVPGTYVSGDNADVQRVAQLAERLGPVDVAVLHVGAARTALLDADLTLGAQQAVEAARLLEPALVVPVHGEGWAHFSQGLDDVTRAFEAAGLAERLRVPVPGTPLELP
jgi:L-ascorbate metabolism protein UlaG (beta-lactamase superfamily)